MPREIRAELRLMTFMIINPDNERSAAQGVIAKSRVPYQAAAGRARCAPVVINLSLKRSALNFRPVQPMLWYASLHECTLPDKKEALTKGEAARPNFGGRAASA